MNGGGKSSATLSINDDGTVSLLEGSADIGGTRSSIAMHVAEVLGLKAEDIIPRIPDTDGVGYTGMTGLTGLTGAQGVTGMTGALGAYGANTVRWVYRILTGGGHAVSGYRLHSSMMECLTAASHSHSHQ